MYQFIREAPITLGLAFVAVLVFLVPGTEQVIEFQANASPFAQIFQALGCHFAHWSLDHLIWDLLMFVIMGVICERRNPLRYSIVLASSALAIPWMVMWFAPEVSSYRGLSGIDTALFGMGIWYLIDGSLREKNRLWTAIFSIVFLGMFAKIGYEYLVGGTLFVDNENFIAVPLAHLVGAVIGCLGGFLDLLQDKSSPFGWQRLPFVRERLPF